MVVEKLFPKKGPRGTYSQAWISRARHHLAKISKKHHTAPIIQNDSPKYMFTTLLDFYWLPQLITNPDNKSLEWMTHDIIK